MKPCTFFFFKVLVTFCQRTNGRLGDVINFVSGL